jgi:hypothetical protein
MYGMSHKTTIYLPDDLKRSIEREASSRPAPTAGLFEAEPFADDVDELLAGFGES